MGQAKYKIIDEYTIFIIIATIILLVFIGGIIVFIFQYHKRKLIHEKEKAIINEQHLQDILNTRLEIQLQTMEDIGREIHDNVGQKLTLASIYANQITYENKFPGQREQIATIGTILDESIEELRSLSRSLTNTNVEIAELKTLIQNECRRVNELGVCQLACTFNEGEYIISNTVKNFILRIIQEFLQNSLKHAGCKHISLNFEHGAAGLEVQIEDDGTGFNIDSAAAKTTKGIGLTNMKKRAELIGADFSFTSVIGKGTRLALFIPDTQLNNI